MKFSIVYFNLMSKFKYFLIAILDLIGLMINFYPQFLILFRYFLPFVLKNHSFSILFITIFLCYFLCLYFLLDGC